MFRAKLLSLIVVSCGIFCETASFAQTPQPQTPLAATAQTPVPALVPYSGVALGPDGKPLSGETSVTFLIFKDEQGGQPLWAETQSVQISANGRYNVQLGATSPAGLPQDLFSTGEARWLEVQVAGQTPQSRVLLASVPYSMKAADAATLGGLPPSAFLKAEDLKTAMTSAAAAPLSTTITANAVTTPGGTAGFVPSFTGASAIANSEIFDTGSAVGIGTTTPSAKLDVNGTELVTGQLTAGGASITGQLDLPQRGTATATAGQDSHSFLLQASAFNSSTKSAVTPEFEWEAEPTGNNTGSPSGTLNLLTSGNGSSAPAETGFYFNPNGTIHFASGQTFPGAGSGTITGVTAGTDLIGGGTSGKVTLNVDTTKVVTSVTAGTGLTGGGTGGNLTLSVNPAQVPLLNNANLFTQNLTVGGQIIAGSGFGTGAVTGGIVLPAGQVGVGSFVTPEGFTQYPLGFVSYPLDFQSTTRNQAGNPIPQDFLWQAEPVNASSGQAPSGSLNLLYGLNNSTPAETGVSVNANGQINAPNLFLSRASGQPQNPVLTVQGDDNGQIRGTPTQIQVQGSSNSNKQLLIGYLSDGGSDLGFGAIQATVDNVQNTPLILNPNGGGVGIQTTSVTNILTLGQGQGVAVGDGWQTYSSRRFKTNIQTLTGALDKVERMRGVSYTLKATGKREVGVIAEEVGEVVPEAVTYEKNGVDAQSVDYNRLTAVLIQATKEQQAEIAKQGVELKAAMQQIRIQQREIRKQAAALNILRSNIHAKAQDQRSVSNLAQSWKVSPGDQALLVLK